MRKHDHRALQVAQRVQQHEQPDLAILFGSRSRGDHDELKSDIDIMLVQETEPDTEQKRLATQVANKIATETYGQMVQVELVWRTLDQFPFQQALHQQRRNQRRTRRCHHAAQSGKLQSQRLRR